ncbi:hypothetical protein J6590_048785 [Homalodisca vitripennis]|nr:hypothetical protein J6590_048785 [Homalodisca vitripennis]
MALNSQLCLYRKSGKDSNRHRPTSPSKAGINGPEEDCSVDHHAAIFRSILANNDDQRRFNPTTVIIDGNFFCLAGSRRGHSVSGRAVNHGIFSLVLHSSLSPSRYRIAPALPPVSRPDLMVKSDDRLLRTTLMTRCPLPQARSGPPRYDDLVVSLSRTSMVAGLRSSPELMVAVMMIKDSLDFTVEQ